MDILDPEAARALADDLEARGYPRVGALRRTLAAGWDALGGEAAPEGPLISVVLPMYNEEDNLAPLLERLVPVLAGMGTYEVIFVNDGSRDRSCEIVLAARAQNPSVRLIDLSRNFGHQAALSAGLEYSTGRAVFLMDCDLQDPPEVLPEFVAAWKAGSDVVYAVREKRKEGPLKRMAYFLFYRMLRKIANIDIPLDSGDFCLMDRKVVDAMLALPEKNRFLRGLRSWVGFRQTPLRYERAARHAGEPKYSFSKLLRLAMDGLISFTKAPLQMAVHLGLAAAGAGLVYLLYILGVKLLGIRVPVGWSSLVAIVLLMGGIQLVILGVLGEYIGRIFDETKNRPNFVVGSLHGLGRRRDDLEEK